MIPSFPCFYTSTSVSMVFLFYSFINEQTNLQCKTWQLQSSGFMMFISNIIFFYLKIPQFECEFT